MGIPIENSPWTKETVKKDCPQCDWEGYATIQVGRNKKTVTCENCSGFGYLSSHEENREVSDEEWLSLLQQRLDDLEEER